MLNRKSSATLLLSDMADHYVKHQARVLVGVTLTLNMLLHAK